MNKIYSEMKSNRSDFVKESKELFQIVSLEIIQRRTFVHKMKLFFSGGSAPKASEPNLISENEG